MKMTDQITMHEMSGPAFSAHPIYVTLLFVHPIRVVKCLVTLVCVDCTVRVVIKSRFTRIIIGSDNNNKFSKIIYSPIVCE